jgi:hypothetical protein
MQVHHIVAEADGGPDTLENAIPLCLDCHAEVRHYDPKHPIGRKFSRSELRRHRDQWYKIASHAPWADSYRRERLVPTAGASVDELLTDIEAQEVWRPEHARALEARVLGLDAAQRATLVEGLDALLLSPSEDARWNAALMVEFLIQWEPLLVPLALLTRMGRDGSFSVRSSAAVCYYWLATAAPAFVPVELLGELAAPSEDWYVATPALSALVRLSQHRPVAVDVIARGLTSSDPESRRFAADGLARVMVETPSAIRGDIADLLCSCPDKHVSAIGVKWRRGAERRRRDGLPFDGAIF